MKDMFKNINQLPIISRIIVYVFLYFVVLMVIGFTFGFVKGIFASDNNEVNNEKQFKLENCIENAKISREDLWNANCVQESDDTCTIYNNSTRDWIEKSYQQELEICYKLYD